MKNKILLLIGIAPAILLSCKTTPCADVLIKKDTTVKSERENTLFAFVGEKIEVKYIPPKEKIPFDSEFRAKYKVLQRIYGCYPGDTIEFTAFDHHGRAHFSKFKNVLLYVSKFEGKYYHEKYQYDDVYMTKSGKWAGPYEPYDAGDYNKLNIIPKRIDFADPVTFPLNTGHDYPHPFYWTVGDKAIADYGIYVENLFKIKKEGVLKARGLFGKEEEEEDQRLIPQDVQLEEVPAPDSEQGKVKAFWKKFAGWLVQKNTARINQTLLDSLWVCGSLFTKQKLLSGCFNEIFDSTVVAELKRRKNTSYTYTEVALKDLLPCARNRIVKDDEGYYRIKKLELFVHTYPENIPHIQVSFIKTKNGYHLYDIRYPRNRSCCF